MRISILLLLFGATMILWGCSDNGPTYAEIPDAVYNPSDAFMEGNTLWILYGDRGKEGEGFVGVFERADEEWGLIEEIWADLPNGLRHAHTLNITPEGDFLISDSVNGRVPIINVYGEALWEVTGFDYPNDAEVSDDGNHIWICDNSEGSQRIIKVEKTSKQIVWEFSTGEETHDVDELGEGVIQFVRSMSNTVDIVNKDYETIWKHKIKDEWPRSSETLSDETILVAGSTSIIQVTEDHQENVIISGLEGLYNVHYYPDEGILACTWEEVLMISETGSILWSLQLSRDGDLSEAPIINPDRVRVGLFIEEYHRLSTIGYISK